MKLKQIQKEFAAHLYDKQKKRIFHIVKKNAAPAEKRLQIYRNNVFGNFDNALEMIYPAIKNLVGDDYFAKLANLYHQQYRSPTGNLDDYGKFFSSLILSLKKEHKLFYLKDIAKLEWLYHIIYFSKYVKPIDIEKLQNLKPKEYYKVKFKLHPSCYLQASNYPIYSVWSLAVKNSQKKSNITKKSGEYILLERANLKSNIHQLSKAEYYFLENIKKKNNIYQIYKILDKDYPDFDIGALINKYISIGVLSDFYIS